MQVSQAQRRADTQRILDAINAYRVSQGAPKVRYSPRLSQIVQYESDRMIREETFYHTNNFLNDWRAGQYTGANEVIALEYHRDVRALVDWWNGSPAHEAAIRNGNHDVIGIGITYADGHLTNTGKPWKVLATVNLYGYSPGKEPPDTSTSVHGTSFSVIGGIGNRYHALGGAGALGHPVMNEQCGLVSGGCWQEFVRDDGRETLILWSPGSGAHAIKYYGAIGQEWIAAGREHGFGYPLTDEIRRSNGSVYQRFSHGDTLNWAPGHGVWVTD